MQILDPVLRVNEISLSDPADSFARKTLSSFMSFSPTEAGGKLPSEFSNCTLYNAYLNIPAKNWSGNSTPPPDPGLFAQCFPTLLRSLVGNNAVLTLFVKSLDPSYFDELVFIRNELKEKKSRFVLLSRQNEQDEKYSLQRSPDLFFEWSPIDARSIVNQWFISPQMEIEGYVSSASILAEIALTSRVAAQPKSVRDFLNGVSLAFRLWPDFNGLLVLTTGLSGSDLSGRLSTAELEKTIQSALSDPLEAGT